MQPATAPFILRSIYKDDFIVETQLTRPATELMTNVFGAQFTNRHDASLAPVTHGAYTFFSMLRGQTLGEEFCDLLPVTGGNPWRTIGIARKTLLAMLQVAEPTAIDKAARFFFPNITRQDVAANAGRIVLCLLCLFERYGTLPHRIARIRYLSLKPSRALEASDGAPRSYLVLGLVMVVELAVRLYRYRRDCSEKAADGAQAEAEALTSTSDDDEEAAAAGKCMLCLSHRKCPTATLCGHVFCWRCIAEWIRSNPHEAVCPFCRQSITPQTLVPLYFYVSKEGPQVGSAVDADVPDVPEPQEL